MEAVAAGVETAPLVGRRIGITSVFGDPIDPRTWSGAPSNLAAALRRLGAEVVGIHSGPTRGQKYLFALDHLVRRRGGPVQGHYVRRDAAARAHGARVVAEACNAEGLDDVLHTGTFDLPIPEGDGRRHFLYCDHTWALALRHLDGAQALGRNYLRRVEALERASYAQLAHVFSFGAYVRDNLITHYGVPAARVTVVGSGMGPVEPYDGPKDYATGPLMFVAKHLFAEKGGPLLLDAFRRVRKARPDATLEIVAKNPPRTLASEPGVTVHDFLPWSELAALYRRAALLVQPMLNDPWGQVYLEALASRTPVVGLARNGLPEITQGGRTGFLVAEPDAAALAETVIDALATPDRLAAMGLDGKRHVAASYSWDRVAERIAGAMRRPAAGTFFERRGFPGDGRPARHPSRSVERSSGTWAIRSH